MLSILRHEQYRQLTLCKASGITLDIGGGRKSDYHRLIKGSSKIFAANINIDYECDIVCDSTHDFPFKNNSIDTIVCLNVLEHIPNPSHVLRECCRVLTNNGKLFISTPFMHQIHGSPFDYYRYTDTALKYLLEEVGFSIIRVIPLNAGVFGLLHQLTLDWQPGIVRSFTTPLARAIDKIANKIPFYKRLTVRIPLGYFIVAKK